VSITQHTAARLQQREFSAFMICCSNGLACALIHKECENFCKPLEITLRSEGGRS
jgi:hypothetical protein